MLSSLKVVPGNILKISTSLMESKRTTYIFKRMHPVRLNKLGADHFKKLKRKTFYYDVIQDTNEMEDPTLELVLVKNVPGLGMAGEKVISTYFKAYHDLILPKLAVYASSPEAKNFISDTKEVEFSSIYTKFVEKYIAGKALPIILNDDNKWNLEEWHVKMALRQIGLIVKNDCVRLPDKKISGPDAHIENKDFIVNIIMNQKETFPIRCRIFLWNKQERKTGVDVRELNLGSKCLFPEEADTVKSLMENQLILRKIEVQTESEEKVKTKVKEDKKKNKRRRRRSKN